MYPAIFSRTYPAKSAVEVFHAIKRDGYGGVQMNLSSLGLESLPLELPGGVAEKAGELARSSGMKIAALSGTYNMAHPDPAYRHEMRPRFVSVLQAAQRMGVSIVTLCTGSRNINNMWEAHPDNPTSAAYSDLRDELDWALAEAEKHGLALAIEPEPGNVIRDAQVARRLLDEVRSPRLKIILDAANLLSPSQLAQQKEIMAEATDLLGADTVLAHAKDFNVEGKVVAPMTGVVDLPTFAQLLRRAGYNGALIGHGFEAAHAKMSATALAHLCHGTW
jgi:sugar phosphate isomerase/epimerase